VQVSTLVLGVLGASVGFLASFLGWLFTDQDLGLFLSGFHWMKWPVLAASTAACLGALLGTFLATNRPRVGAALLLVAAAWLFGEAAFFSQHVSSVSFSRDISRDDPANAAARMQERTAYERTLSLATLPIGAGAALLVMAAGLVLLRRSQAKYG
jgi:hypothetical protein